MRFKTNINLPCRFFSVVIEKAQIACSQRNNSINSDFGVNTKIVAAGKSLEEIEREKNKVCEESYIGGLYEIKW